MKYFAPLSPKDCLYLLGIFILGFGWLLIDQWFLPTILVRFIALILILCIMFYLLYRKIKPDNVFHYVNSITLVSLLFIVLVSLIIHVLLQNNFDYKSVLIWLVATVIPYLAGFAYSKVK
jgi:hypothetical protein